MHVSELLFEIQNITHAVQFLHNVSIILFIFVFSIGLGRGEVSQGMAFSWSHTCMLCGASIFSDDCQTYFYTRA